MTQESPTIEEAGIELLNLRSRQSALLAQLGSAATAWEQPLRKLLATTRKRRPYLPITSEFWDRAMALDALPDAQAARRARKDAYYGAMTAMAGCLRLQSRKKDNDEGWETPLAGLGDTAYDWMTTLHLHDMEQRLQPAQRLLAGREERNWSELGGLWLRTPDAAPADDMSNLQFLLPKMKSEGVKWNSASPGPQEQQLEELLLRTSTYGWNCLNPDIKDIAFDPASNSAAWRRCREWVPVPPDEKKAAYEGMMHAMKKAEKLEPTSTSTSEEADHALLSTAALPTNPQHGIHHDTAQHWPPPSPLKKPIWHGDAILLRQLQPVWSLLAGSPFEDGVALMARLAACMRTPRDDDTKSFTAELIAHLVQPDTWRRLVLFSTPPHEAEGDPKEDDPKEDEAELAPSSLEARLKSITWTLDAKHGSHNNQACLDIVLNIAAGGGALRSPSPDGAALTEREGEGGGAHQIILQTYTPRGDEPARSAKVNDRIKTVKRLLDDNLTRAGYASVADKLADLLEAQPPLLRSSTRRNIMNAPW